MAKVKVAVIGTVNKVIQFDPDAGDRALAAVEALAQAIDEGVGGTINHSSLRGLQVGDDHPQYAMWQAPETIQGLWDFQTIPLIQGETLAEYIEDVVGSGLFDFIQDTPSIKWTYFDTAAEIEANVDLDWAPVWTNNHRWTDNDEIQLGTDGDLRLYHDGTDSYIDNDTGYLQLQGGLVRVVPDAAALPAAAINADSVLAVGRNSASVSIGLVAPNGGSNGFRFVCAAGGIATLAAINVASNSYLGYIGGSGYDGTNWQTGSAGLFGIRPGSTWSGSNRETFLVFETTASGSTTRTERARITSGGNLQLVADNLELQIGAGQDLRLFHDGTNSTIRNDTGSLLFLAGASTAATMSSGAAFTFNNTVTVGTTSDASTVGVGAINVSNPSGSTADFRMLTGGLNRWIFRKDGTSESGANAGSNFGIIARADDGSSIGNCLTITRSSRRVDLTVAGCGFASGDATLPGWCFTSDSDNGAFLIGTNNWGLTAGGTRQMQLGSTFTSLDTAIRRTNVISPAQITTNTDNYNPTGLASAATLRLSTDASRNLTGIVAQAAGTEITICNVGAQDLVLVHNATSTAANQFLCPGSANFTLNANDSVRIWYDTTSARWRVIEA